MSTIKLSDLTIYTHNSRKENDGESVKKLAESIKNIGLLHPLILRADSGKYQVVAGWQRVQALKHVFGDDYELSDENYSIIEGDEEAAAIISLDENLCRGELSDIDLARSVKVFKETFSKKQHELSVIFGKSQPWVSNMLRLAEEEDTLPPVVRADLSKKSEGSKKSEEGKLSRAHWEEIRKVEDPKMREHLASTVKDKDLSVKKTREVVRKQVAKSKPKSENAEYDFKLQTTTLWNIPACDDSGVDYPGRLPGACVGNLLHYYTKEDDLVLDPCAGGGTTIDVCKSMKRECVAFDLNPVREDIQKNDLTEGLPIESGSIGLIIFDPPYAQTKQGEYGDEASDLSQMEYREFLKAIDGIAEEFYRVLKVGGHLAYVIGNFLYKNEEFIDIGYETYGFFRKHFRPVIRVALSNSNYGGISFANTVDAKKKSYLLNGFRDVLVFTKEQGGER